MTRRVAHHTRWSGLESSEDDAEIGVLGVPFDNAVSWRGGTRHAPERIRSLTPHLAHVTEEGIPLQVRVSGIPAYPLLLIKAMDIVEVSPPLDISDVTSLVALKIIYEMFGFVQSRE